VLTTYQCEVDLGNGISISIPYGLISASNSSLSWFQIVLLGGGLNSLR
jgi:hypothetical protein